MRGEPQAYADIVGSEKYPRIKGKIGFYETKAGVLVLSEVFGLPSQSEKGARSVFGFHIHEGDCGKSGEEAFSNSGGHYNPTKEPHPYHSGDMAPFFGSCGYAFSVFLTDRFSVGEIIGRAVIIHSVKTQPSGNSGEKIACGVIIRRFGC